MLKTSIILHIEDNFPVCHKYTGLAQNLEVAQWMFELTGWKGKKQYPGLSYEVDRIQWEESEQFFPTDRGVIWLLGHKVILN